jgi:putative hydrolase of HD superfamily
MFLADAVRETGVEVNFEKLLRMALLHDWAESRVGDMPRTATNYFGAEARQKAEASAFRDIVSSLRESRSYLELYEDYEHRSSLEAKLVKAADVIDLLIQVLALERAGARGLDEFWEVTQNPNFQLDGVAKERVDAVVAALLKERREVVGSDR